MELGYGSKKVTVINNLERILSSYFRRIIGKPARKESGLYVESNAGAGYSIRIIARGEQLLYKDENGTTLVEICIPARWIDGASIRKWDEARQVSETQRAMIIDRVQRYFYTHQGMSVKVLSSDG